MDDFLDKEEAKKTEQKKRLRRFLIVIAIGVVILLIYLFMATRPLDEIQNYEVEVTPLPKGAVEITYRYDWKVLNDTSEGPLEWVKLGMANYDYGLVEYGGAITGRHYGIDSFSGDGPYACFDLNRAYYKGETASFWFTVTQSSLMCHNPDNESQPFFDFTPGWFDQIAVKHYKFIWNNPADPVSHNADREMGSSLIWEGTLSPGKKRNMRVTYNISDFDSPHLVNWSEPFSNGGGSGIDGSVIFIILIATGYFGYQIAWGKDSYGNGRGYGGGYHGYHHRGGGGGCACACAGCACACACAGGGRAGCSQKDFYSAIHVPKEIPKRNI